MTTFAFDGTPDHLDVGSPSTTVFDFDDTDGREQLLRLYDKGTRRQWIGEDRRHFEAWRFSQFMHGEQGALIGTAKLVQTVPG